MVGSPRVDRQGFLEAPVDWRLACQCAFQSVPAIHSRSDSAEHAAPSSARAQRQASAKVQEMTGAPSTLGIWRMDFRLGMPVPSITTASIEIPRNVASAWRTDSEPTA